MASTTDKEFVLPQLPANILLDIARNESADREWRKAATKLLVQNKCREANHVDLVWFVKELEKEAEAEKSVVAVVEAAIEEELPAAPVIAPVSEKTKAVVREQLAGLEKAAVDARAEYDASYPKLSDQIEECQDSVNKIHEFHGIKRETLP